MAEPFKKWIHAGIVDQLAADLAARWPAFDVAGFTRAAGGLEALELKARVGRVADALGDHLPADWPTAAALLASILPPPLDRESDFAENVRVWPLTEIVARRGLDHADVSLALLREMTRRWSSEFAIRPFLARWPAITNDTLDRWVTDPDPHVRRLVSEGSRPILPWGIRLTDAVRSPERGLARVLQLADDPSAYVRRSVANHVGDVGKSHPELAVDAVRGLLAQPTPLRLQLGKHALRTLLKRGHPGALALFGHADAVRVSQVEVSPSGRIGGTVTLRAVLSGPPGARARIDVAWRWPGARGPCSKTFRVAILELGPTPTRFEHAFPLRPASGRTLTPGVHALVLRVNGVDQPPAELTVS